MPRLVLASASPQRRKLLKIFKIPFRVVPSQVRERTRLSAGGAEELVKHNALIKAQDVAKRQESGLIIGCDTVVYSARQRVILKPANLSRAKKNLQELMAAPHWVYSGIAVVDSRTGRSAVDYERTKVFMRPLSSEQIDQYHRRVSPLDKAGGFDIEGLGAVFIPRIEGCYFNVVGLPLAKLAHMLREFGVQII